MKRILHVAALTMVLTIGGQAVWAQEFDKGLAAAAAGDFEAAIREFRPLAEQGNAIAQNYLGEIYRFGEGGVP